MRKQKARLDPATPPAKHRSKSSSQKRSFANPIKREAWQKAEGRCEFVAASGKRCEARYRLEFDHRDPVAHGGLSDADNARVLCKQHNFFEAVKQLGPSIMANYRSGLRT